MSNESAKSYRQAYETLQSAAEKVRQMSAADIDELVPTVDAALQAYRVCSGRLAEVRRALGEKLPEELEALGRQG